MRKKQFYVKPTTTVICAEGGSLLAGSGITVGGEDFPWERGATGNDDPWQMPIEGDLATGLEDTPEDDDAW